MKNPISHIKESISQLSEGNTWMGTDTLRFDRVGAIAALVVATLLFPLRFFASQVFVQLIPLVIGTSSGIYLVTQRYGKTGTTLEKLRVQATTGHVLRMGTLVGLAAMVSVATVTGGRTPPFFVLATLVFVLIFAQIFFLREGALEPGLVLVQIIGFAIVVRWTALAMTPGLIGVDSWIHLPEYAMSILQSGQLSAIAETKYFGAPLYHLLVVSSTEAFNSTLRTGLYATLGLVMPISLLLVYYTTEYLLPVRWALFATAAYSIADHVIRWGLHIIPTSMGLVFFLAVCYGVTRIHARGRSKETYALVFLFAIATILTHQISTFILLLFLGVGTVSQLYVRFIAPRFGLDDVPTERHTVNFAALFVVTLPVSIIDWSLSPPEGTSFLSGMVGLAGRRLSTPGFLDLASSKSANTAPVEGLLTSPPVYVEVIFALGFSTLMLFTLIGAFTLLQRERREQLSLSWVISSGTMLVVTLGMPLVGLYFLIPSRWYAFMYVPMVILAASGMWYLESHLTARHFVAVLVVFSLLFTGPMLVDEKATHDDPVFEQYSSKYAYSESEYIAAQTISSIHPEGETIHADHPYFLFLRDWYGMETEEQVLTSKGTISGNPAIYRTYQSEGGTQVIYQGVRVREQLPAKSVCQPSMDVVYTNQDVRYCNR